MAHQEACQLFIEQEIKEGLSQGKTPYSIGKELSAWVEKLFRANIPAKTIAKRAERESHKLATNVANPPTPINPSAILKNQVCGHGGGREGAGRPAKYTKPPEPYSSALYLVEIALSQLSRIEPDDPNRKEAFQKVIDWIHEQLKEEKIK